MSTEKVTFEELVNHAIKQGIEEVANVIVYENDAELEKFIAINKAGGPEAYIESLLESTEVSFEEDSAE